MKKVSLILLLLFLMNISIPQSVFSHELSVSYTELEIKKKKVDVLFSMDELSVIENTKIDQNKNKKIDQGEMNEEEIEQMILEKIKLEAEGEKISGKVNNVTLSPGINTNMVDIKLTYDIHGRDVVFHDEFYNEKSPYTNYVKVLNGDNEDRYILKKDSRTIDIHHAKYKNDVIWFSFLQIGMAHILTGFDHLLFLLGVVLVAQTLKGYVKVITSFTIAHSITLILSILGFVVLPGKLVEVLIALSICYIAIENIFISVKHRWVVTGIIGLIHGLGFAGFLKELLPKSDVFIPLVTFNLGIELIQITLILLLLPLLIFLQKKNFYNYIKISLSVFIFILGFLWAVERIFG